jgi:hypothetical protein
MADDPFTEVLKKLWDLFEGNAEIATFVKVANRIKLWDGNLDPEVLNPDTELTTSDLPMVILEPSSGSMNPIHTSTDAMAEQVYRLRMMDGNLIPSAVYFPLKWAIFKALANIDLLLGLTYVKRILVEDGIDERNLSGHPGWSLGIDIRVTMFWSRTFLKS